VAIPPEQADTAALLTRLSGAAPQETHISAVFVAEHEVWKLRKAVRLDFLDFSTLAERRRTAERELELNAPAAPGLYRDVVAVTREADGSLALGGSGTVVDYVVRMARVPKGDFLEDVLAGDGLSPQLLDGLGDAVAASHAAGPVRRRDAVAALRGVAVGNSRAALAAGLDPASVRDWLEAALAAIAGHAGLLQSREQAGFLRRLHGDLHLGNLCLWQGRPTLFDALEFDEDLASIDVGYDLAFVLMDLDVRAGRAAANRVLNRYVARTGDCGFLGLLPLFLSLRAMVRAHVEGSRQHPQQSQAYLRVAREVSRSVAPVVVAIGGLQGTGKSTLARALAPELGRAPGCLVLRSDEIRKRQHGIAPEQRLPEQAYGAAASAAVFASLFVDLAAAAGAGHGVIADAMFIDLEQRAAVRKAAGDATFLGVWLQAPMAVLETRLAARKGDASDADIAILRASAARDPGPGDWLAVDATDGAGALACIRAALAERMC
jgi:aminoglycoside phosphotransferase family enzyme/predicted kinase